MNLIKWKKKAAKQLSKINFANQDAIVDGVDELEAMPNCKNVISLTNHEYQYRLRVGNYRVFFNFDGVIHIVYIEEVKKRDERTY